MVTTLLTLGTLLSEQTITFCLQTRLMYELLWAYCCMYLFESVVWCVGYVLSECL